MSEMVGRSQIRKASCALRAASGHTDGSEVHLEAMQAGGIAHVPSHEAPCEIVCCRLRATPPYMRSAHV